MSRHTKEQLRQRLKVKRQRLSLLEVSDLSNLIALKCLENVNWKGIERINSYSAIKSWREIDPQPLLRALEKGLPDIQIKLQPKKSSANHSKSSKKYDVVIVPVLGFDKKCNRLGTGGGFYDKFLASQPKALKIGLAYEAGKVPKIPAEPTDIAMDIIVTEKRIYRRKANHTD